MKLDNATSINGSQAALHCQILAAFEGDIPPVRLPFRYRLGILLVAIVMVLLPLIDLGLLRSSTRRFPGGDGMDRDLIKASREIDLRIGWMLFVGWKFV